MDSTEPQVGIFRPGDASIDTRRDLLVNSVELETLNMRYKLVLFLIALAASVALCNSAGGQASDDRYISPTRPVPAGNAHSMKVKLVKDTPEEKVYAVIFYKGDEAMSGLTDFAIQNRIDDAHFTGIGAVNGATLAWLDPAAKLYHRIPVTQQVEVLSLVGDMTIFNGKPIVHMHAVLGRPDGTTIGGHVFELDVNPTLEVIVTVNTVPLRRKPDDASGMKVIDPTQ
jgi:predicted DNA-binding protein with PD1-like motif